MASCKDCLCFKRCVALGVMLDMEHDKEADKNCRHFKNKADVVEVKQLTESLRFAIDATNIDSEYNTGLRNGLRLALSYVDGKEPQFEKCAESEVVHGEWLQDGEWFDEETRENHPDWKCSLCGRKEMFKEPYCNCGAKMDKEKGAAE